MYKSKMYNAKETKKILENGFPNVFFKVYHKKKKPRPGGNTMNKSRIDRLEESISNLSKQMNDRFDTLTNSINSLKQEVKDINARLDGIDARLDYNSLKKLPENNSK